MGNLCGSVLAGVKFDDELLVDDGIDFLACGNTDNAATEVVFINQKPIRDGDNLGGPNPTNQISSRHQDPSLAAAQNQQVAVWTPYRGGSCVDKFGA